MVHVSLEKFALFKDVIENQFKAIQNKTNGSELFFKRSTTQATKALLLAITARIRIFLGPITKR